MKVPYAIAMTVVAVLITVAIEESRIAKLRSTLPSEETTGSATPLASHDNPSPASSTDEPDAPARTKSRPELKPATPANQPEELDESIIKTTRKMWENPAGNSLINHGMKIAVAMLYEDFIDGLEFAKEAGDYFKNLLAGQRSLQQELGMKMMGASPEEMRELTAEIEKSSKENDEEIRKFLNNDEDYQRYQDYKNRLPEHQQLDGIRNAMNAKGAPLDEATEAKLMDAMFRARTSTGSPDLSGPKAMEAITSGNMLENFEQNWDTQQESLLKETGTFLNEEQMAAFQEYQKQMKEMQLMGIKMAEKMMSGKKEGEN